MAATTQPALLPACLPAHAAHTAILQPTPPHRVCTHQYEHCAAMGSTPPHDPVAPCPHAPICVTVVSVLIRQPWLLAATATTNCLGACLPIKACKWHTCKQQHTQGSRLRSRQQANACHAACRCILAAGSRCCGCGQHMPQVACGDAWGACCCKALQVPRQNTRPTTFLSSQSSRNPVKPVS